MPTGKENVDWVSRLETGDIRGKRMLVSLKEEEEEDEEEKEYEDEKYDHGRRDGHEKMKARKRPLRSRVKGKLVRTMSCTWGKAGASTSRSSCACRSVGSAPAAVESDGRDGKEEKWKKDKKGGKKPLKKLADKMNSIFWGRAKRGTLLCPRRTATTIVTTPAANQRDKLSASNSYFSSSSSSARAAASPQLHRQQGQRVRKKKLGRKTLGIAGRKDAKNGEVRLRFVLEPRRNLLVASRLPVELVAFVECEDVGDGLGRGNADGLCVDVSRFGDLNGVLFEVPSDVKIGFEWLWGEDNDAGDDEHEGCKEGREESKAIKGWWIHDLGSAWEAGRLREKLVDERSFFYLTREGEEAQSGV